MLHLQSTISISQYSLSYHYSAGLNSKRLTRHNGTGARIEQENKAAKSRNKAFAGGSRMGWGINPLKTRGIGHTINAIVVDASAGRNEPKAEYLKSAAPQLTMAQLRSSPCRPNVGWLWPTPDCRCCRRSCGSRDADPTEYGS